MTEIEFRFWDTWNKEMLYRDLYFFEEESICEIPSPYFSQYEALQYTGKKDKNDKKIYKGDILDIEGVGVAQVMMKDGQWVTYREDCMEVGSSLYGWLVPLEVIGNIYEDAHLLGGVIA